jgi:hypothetical protein
VRRLPPDPAKRARAKLALLALFFAAARALAGWLDWAPGATSN